MYLYCVTDHFHGIASREKHISKVRSLCKEKEKKTHQWFTLSSKNNRSSHCLWAELEQLFSKCYIKIMHILLQAALCVCVCTARLNHLLTACNLSELGLDECVYVYMSWLSKIWLSNFNKNNNIQSLKKMFNSQHNYSVA